VEQEKKIQAQQYQQQQYQKIEKKYDTFSQNTPCQIHPNVALSKTIDTNEINNRLLNENLESLQIADTIKPNQEQSD